mmetsp:Transcript_40308/g.98008  ORF Transcript_40308/g.98008 Transcript_40308/m.98008 type:complete len:86 (+) Transcript_40308:485-742(+)
MRFTHGCAIKVRCQSFSKVEQQLWRNLFEMVEVNDSLAIVFCCRDAALHSLFYERLKELAEELAGVLVDFGVGMLPVSLLEFIQG